MAKRSKTAANERPRILVLEGKWGSSAERVTDAGGIMMRRNPTLASQKTVATIETGRWDALLLTGGGDVDPRRYGAKKPSKFVHGVSEVRDEVELMALDEARKRNVPVLGICRGSQILNVWGGGTLTQHIEGHEFAWHPVTSAEQSLLRRTAGERFFVRSLHHQEVGRVASGFRIVAYAFDGTIEAIEAIDGRSLGVQFHPELNDTVSSRAIFRWLVMEAARRARLPEPSIPQRVQARREAWTGHLTVPGMISKIEAELDEMEVRARILPPKQQHRKAGTRTFTGTGRNGPVTISWLCPDCGIRFDNLDDRTAHIAANVCAA